MYILCELQEDRAFLPQETLLGVCDALCEAEEYLVEAMLRMADISNRCYERSANRERPRYIIREARDDDPLEDLYPLEFVEIPVKREDFRRFCPEYSDG